MHDTPSQAHAHADIRIHMCVPGEASTCTRRPIKDTYDGLRDKIGALREKGQTALGPALLVALGLASQHGQARVYMSACARTMV